MYAVVERAVTRQSIDAGLVGPRFVEFHTAAAEVGDVGAGLQRPDTQNVERDRARRAVQPDQPRLGNADR